MLRGVVIPPLVAVIEGITNGINVLNVDFGALTLAGDGGVAVTGSSIVSGDTLNHWQINALVLSPTAAGEAAGLSGSPYTLGLNDGQIVTATAIADTYSVAEDELGAVIAVGSAVSGKTISGRPGAEIGGTVAGDSVSFTTLYASKVTLTSDSNVNRASIRRMNYNAAGNVKFTQITISDAFRDGIDVSDSSRIINKQGVCGSFEFDDIIGSCVPFGGPGGDYLKFFTGDGGSTASDVIMINSQFNELASACSAQRIRNEFRFEDNTLDGILADIINQQVYGDETADWSVKRNFLKTLYLSAQHSDMIQFPTNNMIQNSTNTIFVWENHHDPSLTLGLFPDGLQQTLINGSGSFGPNVDVRGNTFIGDMGVWIDYSRCSGFVGFNSGIQNVDATGNKAQLITRDADERYCISFNVSNANTKITSTNITDIDNIVIGTVNQTNYDAAFDGPNFGTSSTDSEVDLVPKVGGDLDTSPIRTGFGQYTVGDEPPILWNFTADNILTTSFDVSARTSINNGTLYWVVTQSATVPTAAQIIAGQDHTGSAADFAVNQAISTYGTQANSATGLVTDTNYFVYAVQEGATALTGVILDGGLVATGTPAFAANAINFDGSSNVTQTTGFTGGGNSKQGLFSLWFYNDNVSWIGTGKLFSLADSGGNERFGATLASSGRVSWTVKDSGANNIFVITTPNDALANQTWQHITGWFDTTSGSEEAEIFVDGVPKGTATPTTDALMATIVRAGVGAASTGTSDLHAGGQMSEVWIATTETLDMGITANEEKFALLGKPVVLGADGSTPTGNQPEIYLTNPTATWQDNEGSAGGFTENGTLTTAATSPSD